MDEDEQRWQDSGVKDEFVEKTALVSKDSTEEDNEVYSSKRFFKARSFKLGLVFSLIVLISVIVIVVIVVGVMAGLYSRRLNSSQSIITLDDVFDPKFSTKFYGGSWLDGQIVTMTMEKGVTLYNTSSGQQRTLISAEELKSLDGKLGGVYRVELSPSFLSGGEEEVILLVANRKQVYRHSMLADYYLYSPASSPPELRNLTKPVGVTSQFQYVTWSPNGEYLAYVIDYNIYVLEVGGASSPIPMTTDGSKTGVVYGIPDWVYEEEVFATDHALWWSPDSQKLLFVGFDDSEVEPYSFPVYGSPEEQYTTMETIAYPKPGTPNPTVAVYVKDIYIPEINVTLLPGSMTAPSDHYLAYAGWFSDGHIQLGWLNRDQTLLEFCRYRLEDAPVECNQPFRQTVTNGWVEQYDMSTFVLFEESGSDKMLVLNPQAVSGDSYTHLLLRTVDTEQSDYLTGPGTWEVTDIVGRTAERILYISAEESPMHRHLYSYSFSNSQTTCLSCDQSNWNLPPSPNPSLPESCDYFTASCDNQLTYCLLNCLGPCVGYTVLARYDQQGEVLVDIKVMEGNAALRDAVSSVALPTSETINVPDDDAGPRLNGMMMKPPGFDASKEYPVLVYVYGGPNSQVVAAQSMLFSMSRVWWVSNLSLILVSVDGRGTGLRGDNFKFTVYKNLGYLETVDQNRAGQYLQTLSYVDKGNMAIYGSSYGGYMAGRVGSSGSGVFSAAISQSPVSDWHYYDSIYTERYMLTPDQNTDSYKASSILPRAGQLADVDYLLIHGTGDDNVHYQHTAQLAEALSEADVQFRMQVYTDKDHSLIGGNTRRHLYQLIADFLRESFQL